MKDEIKFTLRIEREMAQKLDYIAAYYSRSRSSEINRAARKHIAEFAREFGPIETGGFSGEAL